MICHSDKELASPTFKAGFGYHPLTVWLDNTNEALAAVLRTGRAGSNTTTDHIAVTDLALAQIPDDRRHGTPILISANGAGATKQRLAHLRAQRDQAVDLGFSVGFTMTDKVQSAILDLRDRVHLRVMPVALHEHQLRVFLPRRRRAPLLQLHDDVRRLLRRRVLTGEQDVEALAAQRQSVLEDDLDVVQARLQQVLRQHGQAAFPAPDLRAARAVTGLEAHLLRKP